jgi:hypothetical protein
LCEDKAKETLLIAFPGLFFDKKMSMMPLTKFIHLIQMFFSLLDCIEKDGGLLVREMALKLEALAAFIGVVALLLDGNETFPVSTPIFVCKYPRVNIFNL